jgi:hypothetical protein
MAVFAPMPSARERIATSVTTGVAFNVRNASRMSDMNQLPRVALPTLRRSISMFGWSPPIVDLINNGQLPQARLWRSWLPGHFWHS